MSRIVNNVDLDKTAKAADEGRRERSTLRKKLRLRGEWNLDRSLGYQFRTEVQYEKGKQVIEVDSPSYLGGEGNRPGPMAYCIAGIASCFISTFAAVAASEGVELTGLSVGAVCDINFAKTLDVADEPITEGIEFTVEAAGKNADRQRLQGLVKMAEERCPGVYSMSHVIRVSATLA